MTHRRRWTILGAGVVLAGLLAGGVVASQFRWLEESDALIAAMGTDPLVRVADIDEASGTSSRGVFVQLTSTGHFCLWEAPSATSRERSGGCNDAEDPLGGREVSISFGYDGGPAVADVKDATLIGLALPEVASVHVLMSDKTRREMRLKRASIAGDDYRAFGYRFKKADLRRGVAPTAVVALNDAGEEVDRQPTGFAG
jgi:hypothetical protein